ncbi:hypothetical protein [Methylocucumis oryzae]|uniref:Uncharacterized protein n=1 Tax=Methylocucumis oryzae TaxID=1632867 RepID=A0A0F3IH60_9GAMM|nr:hypothetical protein [Methylocucumis oryzae]KJV05883.1 hypothetical protein VZ94_14875 [Methylocucumis oryzae]
MHRFINHLLNQTTVLTLLSGAIALTVSPLAHSGVTAAGTATLVYNKSNWSTVATTALNPAPAKIAYTDIHATPTGVVNDAANTNGQRWMMLQNVANQTVSSFPYPSAWQIPVASNVPITTAATYSFAMPVNCYTSSCSGWGTGYTVTTYDSVSNPGGWIGLGGSLKVSSDFNEPGGTVWWGKLALKQDTGTGLWWIYDQLNGSTVFQLVSPVVTTKTCSGIQRINITASYKFGNSDWGLFFDGYATPGTNPNTGKLDLNKTLGTFSLIPC